MKLKPFAMLRICFVVLLTAFFGIAADQAHAQYTFDFVSASAVGSGALGQIVDPANGYTLGSASGGITTGSGVKPFFSATLGVSGNGKMSAIVVISGNATIKITGPIHPELKSYGVNVIVSNKGSMTAYAVGSPTHTDSYAAGGIPAGAFSMFGQEFLTLHNPKHSGMLYGTDMVQSVTIDAQTGIGTLYIAGLDAEGSVFVNSSYAYFNANYCYWVSTIEGPDGVNTFPAPSMSAL